MKIVKSKTWKCGWCTSGAIEQDPQEFGHSGCRGGLINQGQILLCGCGCREEMCIHCGAQARDVQVVDWQCVDRNACEYEQGRITADNPLKKELEAVRLLGGQARRVALMERTTRTINAAVAAAGDPELLADSAAGLPTRPRKQPVKSTNQCLCECGGTTKGGRFMPGHDMRLKGRLQREAKGGSHEAINRLQGLGWRVPAECAAMLVAVA